MHRLERLYAISEELRRRAPATVTASTLADMFGVTRRTVERDLAALRTAGVAVEGDVGRTGGYALLPMRGNAVVSFTPEEVVALLLATRAAEGMPFATAAGVATHRLLDALPAVTRVAVDELRARILTSTSRLTPVNPAVLRAVEGAVRDRLVIRLRYTDADGVVTTRSVEAQGITGAVDGWYLVGWCRLRDAGRMFRMDRIGAATITRETAPFRPVADVLGWIPHPVGHP
jgi:predicted DNA-binding transcriptional regulator YafY